jgi:hypothetical protein
MYQDPPEHAVAGTVSGTRNQVSGPSHPRRVPPGAEQPRRTGILAAVAAHGES